MRAVAIPFGLTLVLGLAACAPAEADPTPTASSPAAAPAPATTPPDPAPALQTGAVTELATGLEAPWSVVPLPDGGALISERDTATILELRANGDLREVATIADVDPGGEGGLLGLALLPAEGDGDAWLYSYYTSATDNRIVRMPLTGTSGSYSTGEPEVLLDGLAKANNHDGGRLAFGPDGMLYATVGDAGNRDAAQDPDSLNGKILRMTPEGAVPSGNPFGATYVWSMGHRNPQGLAWAADGTMFAAEFGQDTWDELNLVVPGTNYGWPVVEGQAGDSRFADPVLQWSTDEASPSGLASIGGTLFLAGLGGERLWVIQEAEGAASAAAVFDGDYGRIRDAVAAPDGSLWLLTNNTDGRGDPRDGDDRLLRVELAPVTS